MDFLTIISASCSSILTILSLLTVLVKPIREKFLEIIRNKKEKEELIESIEEIKKLLEEQKLQNKQQQEEILKINDALTSTIRNTILNIYLTKLNSETITAFEMENLEHLYSDYKKMGGNSFVENCMENLRNKKIKN